MTRYKQESAKYRKIVAVVLILLAVLAAVSSTSPFRGAKVKEVFETTKYLV